VIGSIVLENRLRLHQHLVGGEDVVLALVIVLGEVSPFERRGDLGRTVWRSPGWPDEVERPTSAL
jgi:hypothetical protein